MAVNKTTFYIVVAVTGSVLLIVFVFTFVITFISRKSKLKWKKNKFPPKSVSQYGITPKYIRNQRMRKLVEEGWQRRETCNQLLDVSSDELIPQRRYQIKDSSNNMEFVESRVPGFAKLVNGASNVTHIVDVRKLILTSPQLIAETLQHYRSDLVLDLELYRLPNETVRDFVHRSCKSCQISTEFSDRYIALYEKAKYGSSVTVEDAREFTTLWIDLTNAL